MDKPADQRTNQLITGQTAGQTSTAHLRQQTAQASHDGIGSCAEELREEGASGYERPDLALLGQVLEAPDRQAGVGCCEVRDEGGGVGVDEEQADEPDGHVEDARGDGEGIALLALLENGAQGVPDVLSQTHLERWKKGVCGIPAA